MPQTESPEYHVRTHPSAVEHWRHVVEIVAFVVAAAWGFYVFVYQEDIKPSLERPNLDFTVNVQHTALGNGEELIAVTPSWKNRGSLAAQIDGFVLNVSGISYTATARNIAPWHSELPIALSNENVVNEYSRGISGTSTPLYTISVTWTPLGGALEGVAQPGDTYTPTRTFVIPQGRFNALRVSDSWCARRADDRRTISFKPVRQPNGTYDVMALPSAENSHPHFAVYCEELVTGIERGI